MEKKVRYISLYLFKTTGKPAIKGKVKFQSKFKLILAFKELELDSSKSLDKFPQF